MPYILSIIFCVFCCIAQGQSNYAGTYSGNNYERDTSLKIMAQVEHKLVLDKDSSFIYSKVSNNHSCNSTYAGFWETIRGNIILHFIGEDSRTMMINEGAGFCALENRKEQLTLVKQDSGKSIPFDPYEPYKRQNKNPKRKSFKQPCPTF